ncbi:MAG: hypothetical protein LKE39_03085 [Sphaerochaeta sp.]|jgi:hypothetical protein|nr:hypothetical protein [Sphaerochaeta sp.]MCI2104619.1 hypothetical protein [Sphaerochaeta sp.]MCI2129332.1 hypothetical protein [Sphaerochaeta sp.]
MEVMYGYGENGLPRPGFDISSMWGNGIGGAMGGDCMVSLQESSQGRSDSFSYTYPFWEYLPSLFRTMILGESVQGGISVPEMLSHVKQIFGLSMMGFTEILGVSRPTLYSYMKGESQPQNDCVVSRLQILEAFAEDVKKAGFSLPCTSILARRDGGVPLKTLIREDRFISTKIPAYITSERNETDALRLHVSQIMKKRKKRKNDSLPFPVSVVSFEE